MFERLSTDVWSVVRTFYAAPAISAATIGTVAVAVGMNLAIFGLIDRALLSPPPHIAAPERVFTLAFEDFPGGQRVLNGPTSYPTFERIRTHAPGVTVAAWHGLSSGVSIDRERRLLKAVAVSGGYFAMLDARPHLGRTIAPDDDRQPAGSSVAVLSHSLWKRAFGGRQVLGQHVSLHGRGDFEIVGVMPAGFSGHSADRVDLWVPLRAAMHDVAGWDRPSRSVVGIGVRLDGASDPAAASSQLTSVTGQRVILQPIIGADIAPAPHRIAYWLAAVSMVVFVIGLANAATLLMLRGARERRDRNIRFALGATRGRLLFQVLIEAAILAAAAGCAALVLAYWLDELVRELLMPSLIGSTGVSRRLLAAAAAGGVCTFLVAATVGALQLPRQVSVADLTGARRTWRRTIVQKELLIVQTTLAVLLIAGAGMFGRSYYNLAHQDFGMRVADVLVLAFDQAPIWPPDQDQLFTTAVERVRALPGVAAATVFGFLPHRGIMAPPISVPGHPDPPELDGRLPSLMEATPEFFDILGISIVQGRRFTTADDAGAPVAIVNEAMARTLWPGTSALGKCFRFGVDPAWDASAATGPPMPPRSAPCREIVGVARDTAGTVPGQPVRRVMHYYVPWSQGLPDVPWPRTSGLLVRRSSSDELLSESIRQIVVGGRTDLPFLEVRRYLTLIHPQITPWQIGTRLLLLFGSIALAVAAAGMYAAFAHSVAERRREMAVRVAMGATRSGVLLLILREGATVAAMGAICGLTVAAFAGRVTQSMFFGTSSGDPRVLGSAGALMLAVAVVATWLPAVAASRADPNVLLRSE